MRDLVFQIKKHLQRSSHETENSLGWLEYRTDGEGAGGKGMGVAC